MEKRQERMMNSADLIKPKKIIPYDERKENWYEGNKIQNNIIKNYFPTENIIVEIKADKIAYGTFNAFIEVEQICCGEKHWRPSGIYADNEALIWMLVFPDKEDKLCEGIFQPNILKFKTDLEKIVRLAIKDKTYTESKNTYPHGAPHYVLEGHEEYHSYVVDKCADGSLRYSRGILIPLKLLTNPFTLKNRKI